MENSDIISIIQSTLGSWQCASDNDMNEIKANLDDIIEAIQQEHFAGSSDYNIYKQIHCVVHNLIWDTLMPPIRAMFIEEDGHMYEKCKSYCKFRSNLNQDNNSLIIIPCTSAVVELSMIDIYKSPLEMLNCLCTSYDLIYAELKAALVAMISQDSDIECEIPVINNEEVIKLITKVLIKSKMLHFCSNIFYIRLFGQKILENDHNMRSILNNFEEAKSFLLSLEQTPTKSEIIPKGIDSSEMITLLSEEEGSKANRRFTLESEKRKRIVSLVMKSTTEKDLVPLDPSNIFI